MLNNFKSILSDKTVAKIFIFFIFFYVIFFGLFISHGFQLGKFNLIYLSILLPIFMVDSIKTILECAVGGSFYKGGQDLSKITVVIPTKNGGALLEKTIEDLIKRIDPKRIIVASNGSTDDTCKRAGKYGVVVINLGAVGKVAAINMSLDKVRTPFTLIVDDDTLIGSAIIPTQALDDGFEGVAFRVVPKIENWISMIQMYEYRKSMDISKYFHNKKATVQNISGAIGLFRTEELIRQTNLHTGEFSGEDLQRTLLIHLSNNSKGVVISDSLIETEVPNSIGQLYRQRVYGWNPGLLSNLLNYLKLLFRKHTPLFLRYDAFYNSILVTGTDFLRLITLPIIIFYPWYFAVLYIVYIIAETIPYLAMRRQDPYWVVLVYPFYGLFGFITRILASAVFIYRRFVVKINRSPKLDDYKNGRHFVKFISSLLTVSLGLSVIGLPILCRSYSQYFSFDQTVNALQIWGSQNDIVKAQTETPEEQIKPASIPDFYIVSVEYGDGKTNIARKAISKYTNDVNLSLTPIQAVYAEDSLRRKLVVGDLYRIGQTVKVPTGMIAIDVANSHNSRQKVW